MNRSMGRWRVPAAAGLLALTGAPWVLAQSESGQVAAGRAAYQANCAGCHGANMTDGQFAPALKGAAFLALWNGASADKLDRYIRTSMPPASAGQLDPQVYSALTAFIREHPGADPQEGRTLIRNARREAQQGKPPRYFRELFQRIKTASGSADEDNEAPAPDHQEDDEDDEA